MIHSFLLIGQSNMAGRGNIDEAPCMDCQHIKILKNGRWQDMFRPINPDRAFAGFNLAESFAEAYAKKYGVDVGLICCADGGTSLEEWKEGGVLYENALSQARLAMRTSTLAGILWHQGEMDCGQEQRDSYAQRFQVFCSALRRDLHAYDIPVLVGGLGDFLEKSTFLDTLREYAKLNAVLEGIANSRDLVGFVSAKGLSGKADNLHFDTKALYEFGLRYFEVFEGLRDKHKVFEEKDENITYGVMNAL